MNLKKVSAKVLSVVMALAMMLAVCAPAILAATEDTEGKKELNYVSLGDSMTNGYGFIRISNVEGECVIAQFFSEHEDVIKDKALKMVESFKLTGTEELDEKSFDESFARTDAIYEKFFPEEMAAYREELEANEEAMENGAYLDAPTTEEIIDNSAANGKTLAFDEFEVQMETGDEYDLTLIGTAAEDGVEYVSSNPEVVTTDQNGHIKAVGAGDAAIIAYTDYGAVAKAYIFVLEGKEAAK